MTLTLVSCAHYANHPN